MINSWLAGFVGESAAPVVGFILLFAFVLLAVVILFAIIRRLTGGTFVAGGRNRMPRLSVTDAAAVDSRRRLVLVRRDDVEHLILIGGPTDVVVEQNIRQGQRPEARAPQAAPAREAGPAPAPAPVTPRAPQPAARVADAPPRFAPERAAPPAAPSRPQQERPQAERRQPIPPVPPAHTAEPQYRVPAEAAPARRMPIPPVPPVLPAQAAAPEPAAEAAVPARTNVEPPPSVHRPQEGAAEAGQDIGSVEPSDRIAGEPASPAIVAPAAGGAPRGEPAMAVSGAERREPSVEIPAREPFVELGESFEAEFSDMFSEDMEAGAVGDEFPMEETAEASGPEPAKGGAAGSSIEDEMERLLGELSKSARK